MSDDDLPPAQSISSRPTRPSYRKRSDEIGFEDTSQSTTAQYDIDPALSREASMMDATMKFQPRPPAQQADPSSSRPLSESDSLSQRASYDRLLPSPDRPTSVSINLQEGTTHNPSDDYQPAAIRYHPPRRPNRWAVDPDASHPGGQDPDLDPLADSMLNFASPVSEPSSLLETDHPRLPRETHFSGPVHGPKKDTRKQAGQTTHSKSSPVPSSQSLPVHSDTSSMRNVTTEPSGPPPKSAFWESYFLTGKKHDYKMGEQWNHGIDVLLVFAALFCAVLTAFIVEFYRFLQPDPQEISAQLLHNLTVTVHVLVSGGDITAVPPVPAPDFEKKGTELTVIVWVNAIWFVSLLLSLGVATMGMLVKQWLQFYERDMGFGTPYTYSQKRQYRFNNLMSWGVPGIILALPIVMYVAVVLFLVGVVLQLSELNRDLSIGVLAVLGLYTAIYTGLTAAPFFFSTCPYRNANTVFIERVFHCGHMVVLWTSYAILSMINIIIKKTSPRKPLSLGRIRTAMHKARSGRSYRSMELRNIDLLRPKLHIDSVIWLVETATDMRVVDIALASIASLKFIPSMVQTFQAHEIPKTLISQATVALPPLNDRFWSRLPSLGRLSDSLGRLSQVPELITSLLHLWHHPSISNTSPEYFESLAIKTTSSEQPRIFGDWLILWRELHQRLQVGRVTMEVMNNLAWPVHAIVSYVCGEATYYHLCRPAIPCYAAPRPPEVSFAEENPFPDLLNLLETHLSGRWDIPEESLATMLNTILFILSDMTTEAHLNTRRDVLILLFKMLGSAPFLDFQILQRVILGIRMFATQAGAQKALYESFVNQKIRIVTRDEQFTVVRSLLSSLTEGRPVDGENDHPGSGSAPSSQSAITNNSTRSSRTALSSMKRVLRLHSQRSVDLEFGKTSHYREATATVRSTLSVAEIATDFFSFAAWQNSGDMAVMEYFLDLPPDKVHLIIERITTTARVSYIEYRSLSWIANLVCTWYFKGRTSIHQNPEWFSLLESLLRHQDFLKSGEWGSQTLRSITAKLSSSQVEELDLISASVCTMAEQNLEQGKRILLQEIVRSGLIKTITRCLSASPKVFESRAHRHWTNLGRAWSKDLTRVSWSEDETASCNALLDHLYGFQTIT